MNKKLCSANQSSSSKSNENTKRLRSEPKTQLDKKKLKLGEAIQLSSVIVNDASVNPRCSEKGESIVTKENQSMQRVQIEATAAASTNDIRTESKVQKPANQQDIQQQSQRPKIGIRIGVSFKPKPNMPNLQGVSKKTSPPIKKRVLDSIRQTLSNTHNIQIEQPKEASQNESLPVTRSSFHGMDNSCQPDNRRREEPLTPYRDVTSDSVSFRRSSSINSTTSPNLPSPNHQAYPGLVLDQQTFYKFKTLFSQMESTLRDTYAMFNNVRSSIKESAETYKKLLGAINQVNAMQNLTSNPSSLRNQTPEVFYATEERNHEARACSSNENQQSNNVDDKATEKPQNNRFRFVLPREYDPYDTKWTLKYRRNMPGLIELLAQSGIYVSYEDLKYCHQTSKDCKSLARRLLQKVFTNNALSVCCLNENTQNPDYMGSIVRPHLDTRATTVLLGYVTNYGLKRGWHTHLSPIISTLDTKIKELWVKYGC